MIKKDLVDLPFQEIKKENLEFQVLDMLTLRQKYGNEALRIPHRLKFNSILIILQGEGTHYIDFQPYSFKKGTVLFTAKNQACSFGENLDIDCYIFEFTDEFSKKLCDDNIFEIFDYMRYFPTLELEDKVLEIILTNIKLLNYQLEYFNDNLKESIVISLFYSLLLQLKRQRVKNTNFIRTKDDKLYSDFIFLLRKFHKYPMKVEDYARSLGISSKTLTRILKKYTKKTTKIYIDEFLLLKIKRYLADEHLTLNEIANKLDFDETTNLVKFFKKNTKITPLEFKKTILQNND